jgi:alkylhydroperoxidase family enzyme
MLAHATGVATPFLRFVAALNTSPLLTERQRKITILRTAALAESEYEWVQHGARARIAGLTDDEIEGVRAGQLEGDEGSLLLLVDDLVGNGSASDATLVAAREFLSVPAIVTLIITVGLYQLLAVLIATAALTPGEISRVGAGAAQGTAYYEALLAGLGDNSAATAST